MNEPLIYRRPKIVLFDLGGVVCQFNPDRRAARLSEAMGVTPQEISTLVFDSGFDSECDRGMHSEEEILARFRSLGFKDDLVALRRHWVSAFTPNTEVIRLAAALRAQGVFVATFTDNGPVLLSTIGTLVPRDAFDMHVFSCMLGATKPHPEAFRSALALLEASASDVFFIDDNERNVTGARAMGLRAERASTAAEVKSALTSVDLLSSERQ